MSSPADTERAHARLLRVLALCIALAACGWLARLTLATRSIMDADESVHAIEALRLHDALRFEGVGSFLEKTYFPERWAPPVQHHLRWYPFGHSWTLLPGFALFGPSDASARLPSVVLLFLSLGLLWAVARRLAPQRGELAGLLAVVLAAASPNLLTFGMQCLVEASSLFTCWLALLLYLRSLEREHPLGRGLACGLALGLAFVTKYDHGMLLTAVLGLCELVRVRFRPWRLLASRACLLFVWPALIAAAWLAHPDKLAAFLDAARHPFYGSPRLILINLVATWFLEHTSSPLIGLFAIAILWLARADLRHPARRVLWLFAALSFALLGSRARFLFRYDYCEAPAFLVLIAAHLPDLWERSAARMAAFRRPLARRAGLAAIAAGFLLLAWSRPASRAIGALVNRSFRFLYEATPSHLGLSLAPEVYVEAMMEGVRRVLVHLQFPLLGAGLGLLVLALWPDWKRRARLALATVFTLAFASGAGFLYTRLEQLVEWELEGQPRLRQLTSAIAAHTPAKATLLLGGGWDEYANNTLRWYLLTGAHRSARFDDVRVEGDMIGSLVLPEEPRIAWWTNQLALAPFAELPQRVVLISAWDEFCYKTVRGSEVDLYRDVLQKRGLYALGHSQHFPDLGCSLEAWSLRTMGGPLDAFVPLGAADVPPGRPVGEHGWLIKDDSWRMLRDPRVEAATRAALAR